MSQYLSDTSHFMLSEKEEEEAIFYASVVDIHEIRREAERRLDILEKNLGNRVTVNISVTGNLSGWIQGK